MWGSVSQFLWVCCLQEIGDFENWVKTMEYDCEQIAGTLKNVALARDQA